MKVNLFLAGFAKSGSSYIYSLLSNQARVSGGLEKEPAFFCFANKKGKHTSALFALLFCLFFEYNYSNFIYIHLIYTYVISRII